MPSEIQICNLAISWLGGQRITSFGDETAEAILCYANYELARDAVLERIEWSFAIKRVILPLWQMCLSSAWAFLNLSYRQTAYGF